MCCYIFCLFNLKACDVTQASRGALPAIEGGDLPSRPPSAPRHRTWFTQAVFICESQMVKHNILTASSSQVSGGQRRKAKNIPARVSEAGLAQIGRFDMELRWPGGESNLSTQRLISRTRAVPSFVPAVYSLLGSFFIRMTFEKHPHWWLPKVSCVTIVPPIVTAADEMSCSFLITTESDITGSDVIRELIQMIWNTRGEMWRGLKDKLDDNKITNQLKFINEP